VSAGFVVKLSPFRIMQIILLFKEKQDICKEQTINNDYSFTFSLTIISLKLSNPASRFSIISAARSPGSGRLSRSARDLSLSQVISRLVLSRAIIS
jgi:hypothetical protein